MSKFNLKFRPERAYDDDFSGFGKKKQKIDRAKLREQKHNAGLEPENGRRGPKKRNNYMETSYNDYD